MAQWWELAIPAVATLGGAWVGAWWQGRSSERQRREQYDRDNKRLFVAERRAAYVKFNQLTADYLKAAEACGEFHIRLRESHADWFSPKYVPTGVSASALNEIAARHEHVSALWRELAQHSLDTALIAPKEVANAASAVLDAFPKSEHPREVTKETHEDGSVSIGWSSTTIWQTRGNLTIEAVRLLQDYPCVNVPNSLLLIEVAFPIANFLTLARKDVGLADPAE